MKILDSLTLPLNCPSLIEASAGTGKTYTMANLYLRLLLGIGCEPLNVEQILVVTFTKAATQELRDRIREKVAHVARLFSQYHQGESEELAQDDFLFALYNEVKENLNQALLRLQIAEQEIDLASIFTLDSFCQKMLYQFAFHSGMRFDIELQTDEQALMLRLTEETWRERFYPMGQAEVEMVSQHLRNPMAVYRELKPFLTEELPELSPDQQALMAMPLADYATKFTKFIGEIKQFWRENGANIIDLVQAEQCKKYPSGAKKALNRRKLNAKHLESYEQKLHSWAKSNDSTFHADFAKFTQTSFNDRAEEGAEPLCSQWFEQIDDFVRQYQQHFEHKQKPLLLFQFLQHFRQKLTAYKQSHRERGFNDILTFLHQALFSSQGEALAEQIRGLFPFAMIDEFQDTNQIQYAIFNRIFMDKNIENQGFIMIGDPKQSIYKFRGADIFTYINASNAVANKATLNRNWRALPAVVESTNQLFTFPENNTNSPFIYQGIGFQPVQSKTSDEALVGAKSTQYFLQNEFDEPACADWCAYHIQQQLKQADQHQLFLQKKDEKRPLEARDITVLVRSHTQASLMREALLKRHIPSVFYSERNSVYESQEAADLSYLLRACLNPYHSKDLLNTLGTALWGLSAEQIYQLKNDEAEWDRWVSCFIHYQQVWQQQGILPMLHQIFIQQGIIERINAQPNAERRITDLLHLAELLQEAMPTLENENALLRWYQQQLDNPNGMVEEQKQRLESDAELVKIVTIHGSKGLEYPIVWLPFVAKPSQSAKSSAMVIYRNEQDQVAWSFGSQSDEIKAQIDQAEFAEDLRLLYVAVTRAKYQVNFILPAQFSSKWSTMGYLLSNGEIGLGGSDLQINSEESIRHKAIPCDIFHLGSEIPQDDWQCDFAKPTMAQAKVFTGHIQPKGVITSFTALQEQHEYLQHKRGISPLATDIAQDYDRIFPQAVPDSEESEDRYSPYQFPHSTKVGNMLHKFFEQWDFQPLSLERIQPLCSQLGLGEDWLEPVQHWFDRIANTPFGEPAFCLAETALSHRLSEWQFYLRLKNEKALPQLNALLKKESKLAKSLPDLQLNQLEGFVRGFVDCIVQVAGKFYVLDYKSNFLGTFASDYSLTNIEKAMGQYRYDLQYLLYTLALHRYLLSRLGENYDYQQNFGGVAYLFLRGMNGEAQSGVYFDKPSLTLIEEMDRLFG